MAKRKRIGIIFDVNKNWMGGTYYILNLIWCLNTLPDENKPDIVLLCKSDEDFNYALEYTQYPRLEKNLIFAPRRFDIILRIVNRLGRMIINRNIIYFRSLPKNIDVLYPSSNISLKTSAKKIYWIPDFQELFLPELFSKKTLKLRESRIRQIIATHGHIVFSSYDSYDSFLHFYPEGNMLPISVLHFAVKPPMAEDTTNLDVLNKYSIPENFFYCANQFWVHKNHRVLIEAIKILKDSGINVTVLCSGGTTDFRNPNYFKDLKMYVEKNQLSDNVRFLGFIDRSEQLTLMQKCQAIIQPSLFEGWSTSVEEAKSMNKYLILSDINLHKEQCTDNAIFFKRNEASDLANAIKIFLITPPHIIHYDYRPNIIQTANKFIEIINK